MPKKHTLTQYTNIYSKTNKQTNIWHTHHINKIIVIWTQTKRRINLCSEEGNRNQNETEIMRASISVFVASLISIMCSAHTSREKRIVVDCTVRWETMIHRFKKRKKNDKRSSQIILFFFSYIFEFYYFSLDICVFCNVAWIFTPIEIL